MGPSARALTAAATLLLAGCDTLFPEFGGSSKPADMALVDGGSADGGDTSPRLAGVVCVLTDLRDYRSCAITSTGVLRVTVEETREQAMTDPTGHFTLPLSKKLEVA